MFIAVLYICLSLTGGEALACSATSATQPPKHVIIFQAACGYYAWPGGTAYIDCGHRL